MTIWEVVVLIPMLLALCVIIMVLSFGAIILLESPRIIPALRSNLREEKKLHFWGTVMDLLVSADN